MKEQGRNPRQVRPVLEGLEDRLVLSVFAPPTSTNAVRIPFGRYTDLKFGVSLADRRLQYTTPDGTQVVVTLYGIGSLAGSSLNADGSLNLVYSGTNASTKIFGFAKGGTGYAPLASILPGVASPNTLSGVGLSPINSLRMPQFTLISGGQVNLTAGVSFFQLYALDGNTHVNLRELPASVASATGGTVTSSENGITLTYSPGPASPQILTKVSGQFTAGANLPYTTRTTNGVPDSGAPQAPPGLDIVIEHVYGPAIASTNPADLAASAAIVRIQGNVQSYKGVDGQGLVLNDIGNLNRVALRSLSDSIIIGQPFGLPAIGSRENVTIVSSPRTIGTTGGVTVIPNLNPNAPLSQL